MSQIKSFSTFTVESELLKIGDFTDSRGRKVSLTKEMIRDIYDDIKGSTSFKTKHNGIDIGEIKKFILKSDGSGIIQKTLITNPEYFEQQIKDGFNYVSPEIELSFDDNDKFHHAKLDGLALSNNPGMITTPIKVEKFHFDAPDASSEPPSNTQTSTQTWHEPLGEMSKKLDAMTQTISKIGDKLMTEGKPNDTKDPAQNMITLSKEELTSLIEGAVNKVLESKKPVDDPPVVETPKSEEPSTEHEDGISKEIMEKLAKITAEHEKLLKRQRDEKFAELKKLGVDDPKTLLPSDSGIPLEQQIAMLDKYKEAFSKNVSINAPVDTPLTENAGAAAKPSALKVDDVITSMGFKPNDELRNAFLSTGLYDEVGVYIGPK